MFVLKSEVKRDEERAELRWLREKSDTGAGETDGGDVDGWVHRRYSTERDLKGTRTV